MIKVHSVFARVAIAALLTVNLAGCSNMDENQQRMVSGGAIGVAAGAVTTVVTGGCVACGMAIGGVVGSAGGYLIGKIDESTRSNNSPPPPMQSSYAPPMQQSSYNNVPQGYPAGGYATGQ